MDEEIKELSDKELANAFTGDAYKMYMREISRFPPLSVDEQKELGKRIQNGDEKAREELINRTLRWVVNVAWHYQNKLKHMKILDVIQEGNLGLMRATEDYDPEKSAFSSYATIWIESSIRKALADKNEEIRKPVDIVGIKNKYISLLSKFQKRGESIPSDDELCDILNITPVKLELVRKSLEQQTVSLDQTITNDEKTELSAFVADTKVNISTNVINQMHNEELFWVLKEALTPLKYFIIYNRLLSDEIKTLAEIAGLFNITIQSVNYIQKSTLKRLKTFMKEDGYLFNKTINKIRKKEGTRIRFLKKEPLSPINIIRYMYLKDDLNDLERKLYELTLLGKYNFSDKDFADILGVTLDELKQIRDSLESKIIKKFNDTRSYQHFKEQMIKTYGTKIFDIDISKRVRVINYRWLEETYSQLSLETILNYFKDVNYDLTEEFSKLRSFEDKF